MMGTIFRTDDKEFMSARAVNALTMEVISDAVENPEL